MNVSNFSQLPFWPPLAVLAEDGLQVAFKQGAGVLEVLFGVGPGGSDAVKRFVEDGDDALLLGKGRHRELKLAQRFTSKVLNAGAVEVFLQRPGEVQRVEVVQAPLAMFRLGEPRW